MLSLSLLLLYLLINGIQGGKTPPNILFILADDLGYGEVEGYADEYKNPSRIIATPQLMQLQKEGIRFTDFYSGEAVCSPARCTLFTGKHTGHATIRGNRKDVDGEDFPLKDDDVTITEILKEAGYQTGMVGKWCFGGEKSKSSPWKKGFDMFFGHLQQAAAHNMYPRYLWEKKKKTSNNNPQNNDDDGDDDAHRVWYPQNVNATRDRCMQANNTCAYSHSLFVDRALDYLEEHVVQNDKNDNDDINNAPFFLYVSLTIPHAGGWTGEGKSGTFPITGNPVPSDGRYSLADWPDVERDHAASITEYLDKDVGRLMDKLDELGISNDTLVIFTSDNGPHNKGGHDVTFFNSSGPFRGYKRSLYEGGIRVPFVVRWPGQIKNNVTTKDIGWFPDMMSTLAEIAGVANLIPNNTDGSSLVGLLTPDAGGTPPPPSNRIFYWEFCTNDKWGQAVRQGQWKLISLDRPITKWELYNLEKDPGETTNLAGQLDYQVLVQKLEKEAERAHSDDINWPTGRSCVPSDSFEHSVSFTLDFS